MFGAFFLISFGSLLKYAVFLYMSFGYHLDEKRNEYRVYYFSMCTVYVLLANQRFSSLSLCAM